MTVRITKADVEASKRAYDNALHAQQVAQSNLSDAVAEQRNAFDRWQALEVLFKTQPEEKPDPNQLAFDVVG